MEEAIVLVAALVECVVMCLNLYFSGLDTFELIQCEMVALGTFLACVLWSLRTGGVGLKGEKSFLVRKT